MPPVVALNSAEVIDCQGGSTTISTVGSSNGAAFQYDWTDPQGNAFTPSDPSAPVVTEAGTYSLTITNMENGCATSSQVLVESTAPLGVAYTLFPPRCAGDEDGAVFVDSVSGGSGPFVYQLGATAFTDQPLFDQLEGGTYELTVQDAEGCEFTETIFLPEPETVLLELPAFLPLALGETFLLQPQTNLVGDELGGFSWSDTTALDCGTCLNPTFVGLQSTTLSLAVTDTLGCEAVATTRFQVDEEVPIFVPNAFSPNADGQNDRFFPRARTGAVLQVDRFAVFDRWGDEVFANARFLPNDPSAGWDGQHRGKMMRSAVFVWVLEVTLINGQRLALMGDVAVLR